MTISNTDRSVTAQGNGVTTEWPFEFTIPTAAEINVVTTDIATGLQTIIDAVDYTVTGLGTPDSGEVVYPTVASGDPALTAATEITIYRTVLQLQLVSVKDQTRYDAGVVEPVWDRLTMMVQDIEGDAGLNIRYPVGDIANSILPAVGARKEKIIAFDVGGNVVVSSKTLAQLESEADNAAQSAAQAAASAAAALVSENAAAATFVDFDAIYLGRKTVDPIVDNLGNPLIDGALYFDTTLNVMKFYDLGNTVWKRTTPTTAEQAAIDAVVVISAEVQNVAAIDAQVVQVAAIDAEVVAVAANGVDISAVAAITTEVQEVAAIDSEVAAVASLAPDVQSVAVLVIGWNFDDTLTMADPGAGNIRFNNAVSANVTKIAVSDINNVAGDVGGTVNAWGDSTNAVKGNLVIQKGGDNGVAVRFQITAVVVNAGWTELSVIPTSNTGAFAALDVAFIAFATAGDQNQPTLRTMQLVTADLDLSVIDFIPGTYFQVIPVASEQITITFPDSDEATFHNGDEAQIALDAVTTGSVRVTTPGSPPVTTIGGELDQTIVKPGTSITILASTETSEWVLSQDSRSVSVSGLTLFATTSADPILAGYLAIVSSTTDVRYDDPSVLQTGPTITDTAFDEATAIVAEEFISDIGDVQDIVNANIVATSVLQINAAPGNAKPARMFIRMYHSVTPHGAGNETLIRQTASSGLITVAPTEYIFLFSNVTQAMAATDRIVFRSFVYKNETGPGDPTLERTIGGLAPGDNPVKVTIPQLSTGSLVQSVSGASPIALTGTAANPIINFAPGLGVNAGNVPQNWMLGSSAYQDQGWSTVGFVWDPASLADGVGETKAVTVPGVVLGDFVMVGAGVDVQEMLVSATVTATDTVEVRLQNETGGVLDLASSTWHVRVMKRIA